MDWSNDSWYCHQYWHSYPPCDDDNSGNDVGDEKTLATGGEVTTAAELEESAAILAAVGRQQEEDQGHQQQQQLLLPDQQQQQEQERSGEGWESLHDYHNGNSVDSGLCYSCSYGDNGGSGYGGLIRWDNNLVKRRSEWIFLEP